MVFVVFFFFGGGGGEGVPVVWLAGKESTKVEFPRFLAGQVWC